MAALLLIIAFGAGVFSVVQSQLRQRVERELYYSNIALADGCIAESRFDKAQGLLAARPARYRHWQWGRLQYLCHQDLMTLKGHRGRVTSVEFSPDGKILATAGDDGTVRCWDAATGREIRTLNGEQPANDVIFSPNGRMLAVGYGDGTIRLWDVAQGKLRRTIKGHVTSVYGLAFSPDGRRLVSGSWDATARIWDVETGRELLALREGFDLVVDVAFSPDSRHLGMRRPNYEAILLPCFPPCGSA